MADLRILIVAETLLARMGLSALLNERMDCDIVGQTTASDSLADEIEVYQPDIILYDVGWNALLANDYLEAIGDFVLPVVILLSNEDDIETLLPTMTVFQSYGVLLSESDPDLVVSALQTVADGLVVIEPTLARTIFQSTLPNSSDEIVENLTPRENEVLQLLAKGMTNKAIAHTLEITEHTVKFHVTSIMTKLNAQSRTEAVVYATRLGLIIL